jgi:hypothetical protein
VMTTYATLTARLKIHEEAQTIRKAREQLREDCPNDAKEDELEHQIPDIRAALVYLIETGTVNPDDKLVDCHVEVEIISSGRRQRAWR